MKFISLFSGIGGFDLGFERAGMECVAQVEIDEFCNRVLAKHWPDVPKFKDVRDVGKHNLPAADLICGGFPCQPHSYAGKRRGAEDDRNLWPEYLRVIGELRPRYVIGENVPGLITTMLDEILSDLEGIGYAWTPLVIPACAFDAPHRRNRIFIVAKDALSNGRNIREDGESFGVREQRDTGTGNEVGIYFQSTIANSLSQQRKETRLQVGRIERGRQWNDVERSGWGEHWFTVATRLCGVDDGLPARLDGFELSAIDHRNSRLAALGNAVVPQVAEWIGRRIMEAE